MQLQATTHLCEPRRRLRPAGCQHRKQLAACAAGESSVILLDPPLPLVGVAIGGSMGGVIKMTVSPTAIAAGLLSRDAAFVRPQRRDQVLRPVVLQA